MKLKVCPRCGSSNIKWIIPQNWSMSSCQNCSFTGPVIEVDEETQKEIEKYWSNNKEKILSQSQENDEEDDLTDEELDKLLDKLFNEE